MNDTIDPKKVRLTMALIALAVGIYLALISRGFYNATMDEYFAGVTKAGTTFGASKRHFGTAIRLFYGAYWAAATTVVGIALVSVSYWLYQGKKMGMAIHSNNPVGYSDWGVVQLVGTCSKSSDVSEHDPSDMANRTGSVLCGGLATTKR